MPDGAALRVHFDPSGDLLDATKACEAATFLHWYGNTREQLAAEYDAYDLATVFVALTEGDEVIGACRLITPGPAGLKSIVDAGREPWGVDGARSAAAAGVDLDRTWDVGTLGIRPDRADRSPMHLAALSYGFITACQVNEVSAIVAVMDDRVRRLGATMGLILHTLPGARSAPYLGSPASTPVYSGFAKMLDTQRRLAPDAYRLCTLGVGLDGVQLPERSAFRLRRPAPVVDLTAVEDRVLDVAEGLADKVVVGHG